MTKLPPPIRPPGRAPVATPRRRSRRLYAPIVKPTNPLSEQAFPSWARPPATPGTGADLALLDQILRLDPPFAGALRQRLALRAAAACAALARHREDSAALRDAEHLSPNAGGNAPTSPAGRARCGSTRRRCAPPPIFSTFPRAPASRVTSQTLFMDATSV
jgi:hypothetical protein